MKHAVAAVRLMALFVAAWSMAACQNDDTTVTSTPEASAVSLPADGWLTRAPLPAPRQEVAVAELDGRVYALGGMGGAWTVAEVYDPATDAWRPIAPLPSGRNHAAAAGVNGRVYVFGGYESQSTNRPGSSVFAYDPATDTWARMADMPAPRGSPVAGVVNGRVYVAGGARQQSVADLAVYDPATDSWTVLAPMPTPRDHAGAAVIDERLYVAGGREPGNFTLGTLEAYDPATDLWQQRASMPTGRSGNAAAAVRGCLYAFGGEGAAGRPGDVFRENEVYDPRTDTWEAAPAMPTPRHGIGAAVVGDTIFIPGGATVQGLGETAVHEAFRPTTSCR